MESTPEETPMETRISRRRLLVLGSASAALIAAGSMLGPVGAQERDWDEDKQKNTKEQSRGRS